MSISARSRYFALFLSLLCSAVLLALLPAPQARALDEGNADDMWEKMEKAGKKYYDLKAKIESSEARQAELEKDLKGMETKVITLRLEAAKIASVAYSTQTPTTELLALSSTQSLDMLVEQMTILDQFAYENAKIFRKLNKAQRDFTQQKNSIVKEIEQQKKKKQELEKSVKEAEEWLIKNGARKTGGYTTSGGRPAAASVPRGPGGSWPAESCNGDDPTTGGCITPRTMHMLNEAKKAGFTRYVSCYRSGGSGEHPKGRACDFSSEEGSFGGVAQGRDRFYGDTLAGWFYENAEALGVMYVIWYKEFWMAGSGSWVNYTRAGGDPSSDHTNHVHVSMR